MLDKVRYRWNKEKLEKGLEERAEELIAAWGVNTRGKERFDNQAIDFNGRRFLLKDWHQLDDYLREVGSDSVFTYDGGILYGRVSGTRYFDDLYVLKNRKATKNYKRSPLMRINGRKYIIEDNLSTFMSEFFDNVHNKKTDNEDARKAQEAAKKLLERHYNVTGPNGQYDKDIIRDYCMLGNCHENGHGNYWQVFSKYGDLLSEKWDRLHRVLAEFGANWVDNGKLLTYGFIKKIAKQDKERARKYLALSIAFNLAPVIEHPEPNVIWDYKIVSNFERPLLLQAYNSEDIVTELDRAQKQMVEFINNTLKRMYSDGRGYNILRSGDLSYDIQVRSDKACTESSNKLHALFKE